MVTSLLQNLGFRFGQSDTNKKCSKGVISTENKKCPAEHNGVWFKTN